MLWENQVELFSIQTYEYAYWVPENCNWILLQDVFSFDNNSIKIMRHYKLASLYTLQRLVRNWADVTRAASIVSPQMSVACPSPCNMFMWATHALIPQQEQWRATTSAELNHMHQLLHEHST